ncbi:MAG: flavin monoamine oxidase family protein [Trueperaceae bacterium]
MKTRSKLTVPRSMSRRHFLRVLGATGGAAAAIGAMDAWGMMMASAAEAPPVLSGNANGRRVIILGAGLAGMTAAYELSKLGYETPIFEARDFAGGRCQTARRGFSLTEVTGVTQRCLFDDGQYINHGPWRIPYHHRSTLHYTKEFDVPLEIMVNDNDNAWDYREEDGSPLSGRRIRRRELQADIGGYTSELLAKAADQDALDRELTAEDKEQLLDYLVAFGQLDRDTLSYGGTGGRGYQEDPGAGLRPGVPSDPFAFRDLLQHGAIDGFRAVAGHTQKNTMFEPVGGMDQIARGFERQVGHLIHYEHVVREIRQSDDGVRVVLENGTTGETREVEGDYCICTIPLSVLNQIPADFSSEFQAAMQAVTYVSVGKMGLQFARRFWEEDDFIYGGHSTTNVFGNISYPSYGWQGEKGVILGYYNFGGQAVEISARSPRERVEYALEMGSLLHPEVYRREFETGFSVAWHLVPHSLGGWASWSSDALSSAYPRLNEPDGRVYLAGEHLSYMTGWMSGAIESAWLQIEKIHDHVQARQGSAARTVV